MINNEKEQKVYDVLEKLDIPYIKYEHDPVYTIEEANKLNLDFKGAHCKNLFIRDRKGKQHYLVIIEESKQANLKDLAAKLDSTPLSFASERRLDKYLGLSPGSVSPFGLINDKNKHVIVVIDKDLTSYTYISFHPNVNTATITLKYMDFEKYLKWCGNELHFIKI